jgi:hypothetical protein
VSRLPASGGAGPSRAHDRAGKRTSGRTRAGGVVAAAAAAAAILAAARFGAARTRADRLRELSALSAVAVRGGQSGVLVVFRPEDCPERAGWLRAVVSLAGGGVSVVGVPVGPGARSGVAEAMRLGLAVRPDLGRLAERVLTDLGVRHTPVALLLGRSHRPLMLATPAGDRRDDETLRLLGAYARALERVKAPAP